MVRRITRQEIGQLPEIWILKREKLGHDTKLAAHRGRSGRCFLPGTTARSDDANRTRVGQGWSVMNDVAGRTRIRRVPADLHLLVFGPYAPVGFVAVLVAVHSTTKSWPIAALVAGPVVVVSVAITAWAIVRRRRRSGRPDPSFAPEHRTDYRATWLPRVGAEAVALDVRARRCFIICQLLFPVVVLLGIVTRDVRVFLPAFAIMFAVGLVGASALDRRNSALANRFGTPIGKRDLRGCLNDRDWNVWASRTGRNPATGERTQL